MQRLVIITLLAWLASLGFDLLLHGGLLAGYYVAENDPFLLSPQQAFARIPLGYASFALLTAMLVWLMYRLNVKRILPGARFGLILGVLLWGSSALGLYSITTAKPGLLVGWFIGQSIELAIAGAVVGAGLNGRSLWKIAGVVAVIIIICLAFTIVMQSLGLAPALHVTT